MKEEDQLQGQENELDNLSGKKKTQVISHLPELRGGVGRPIGGGANGLWMGGVITGVPVPNTSINNKMLAEFIRPPCRHLTVHNRPCHMTTVLSEPGAALLFRRFL